MKFIIVIALIASILILAGCTEQELDNTIANSTDNISQAASQPLADASQPDNTTANMTTQNITVETQNTTAEHPDNIVAVTPVVQKITNNFPAYQYSGNPLDLFKTNTLMIFGDGGPLVAATINLEAYIGTTSYLQDDGGQLPDKNVILLGNCTNSYIASLTSCDGLQDGKAYLKLYKKNNYVLIILANKPSDVYYAANLMIKTGFRMTDELSVS